MFMKLIITIGEYRDMENVTWKLEKTEIEIVYENAKSFVTIKSEK